jgi:hypothetical protein
MSELYEVSIHSFGRPIVKRGPAAGCADFPRHQWERITPRPVGLHRATAIADGQAQHAVVCRWMTAGAVYDNGKSPALPAGWLPERDHNQRGSE